MNKEIPDLVDRGYELKKQLKELTDESDKIKKVMREEATNREKEKLGSGESVLIHGRQHKAKINLAENSFSLSEGLSTTEIRRMKAIIGTSAMSIEEGIKLKDGISLRKAKEQLGDLFDEFFEEDMKVKFDAQEMTKWLNERNRVASVEDPMVDFVSTKLEKTPNTPRVTFSK